MKWRIQELSGKTLGAEDRHGAGPDQEGEGEEQLLRWELQG